MCTLAPLHLWHALPQAGDAAVGSCSRVSCSSTCHAGRACILIAAHHACAVWSTMHGFPHSSSTQRFAGWVRALGWQPLHLAHSRTHAASASTPAACVHELAHAPCCHLTMQSPCGCHTLTTPSVLDYSANALFITEIFRGMAYTLKAFFDPKVTVWQGGSDVDACGRCL